MKNIMISSAIRDAIKRASDSLGSHSELGSATGVNPVYIGRYISGRNKKMSNEIFLRLIPAIEPFLPAAEAQKISNFETKVKHDSIAINESILRDIDSVAHTYSHSDGISFTLKLQKEPLEQWRLLDYIVQSNIIAGIFQELRKQLSKEEK